MIHPVPIRLIQLNPRFIDDWLNCNFLVTIFYWLCGIICEFVKTSQVRSNIFHNCKISAIATKKYYYECLIKLCVPDIITTTIIPHVWTFKDMHYELSILLIFFINRAGVISAHLKADRIQEGKVRETFKVWS